MTSLLTQTPKWDSNPETHGMGPPSPDSVSPLGKSLSDPHLLALEAETFGPRNPTR